ncbi:MAG: hypothetical protein HYY58_03530 [Candidatus Omnitrophica bacterium]|nr:hypothetical protein [Candidatus Omnitrophota bacterium]
MDALELSPGMIRSRDDPRPPARGRPSRRRRNHGTCRELAVAERVISG